MAGLVANKAGHLLGNAPVARVSLGPRAKLDEVHGLAGVHLHHVADSKGESDAVLGLLGKLVVARREEIGRSRERLLVALGEAGLATTSGTS